MNDEDLIFNILSSNYNFLRQLILKCERSQSYKEARKHRVLKRIIIYNSRRKQGIKLSVK